MVSRELGVTRSTLRAWHSGPPVGWCECFRCEGLGPAAAGDYSALLGFYLGDGCLSGHLGKQVLRVSCDRTLPGIVGDVGDRIRRVHPTGSVCHVAAPGVIVVQSQWKHWPCLFPQHGPGRKHEREIRLEDWQREVVSSHPSDFLRGLFHSDGCRVANWATKVVG